MMVSSVCVLILQVRYFWYMYLYIWYKVQPFFFIRTQTDKHNHKRWSLIFENVLLFPFFFYLSCVLCCSVWGRSCRYTLINVGTCFRWNENLINMKSMTKIEFQICAGTAAVNHISRPVEALWRMWYRIALRNSCTP